MEEPATRSASWVPPVDSATIAIPVSTVAIFLT
jgi:hypothetical protein